MQLKSKFEQLKQDKRCAFIAYVPFGFPTIEKSKQIILALQEAGVDIIELGLPFSDPLADGPIIQAASHEALSHGANAQEMFKAMRVLKDKIKVPLVIMTYLNPVLQFGVDKFFQAMARENIYGVMLVDSPLEQNREYMQQAKKYGISTVCFVTPVTPKDRIKKITHSANGFIYYVSVTGTTGPRALKTQDIKKHISKIKGFTGVPVCVGFGIHTHEQVEDLSHICDGVIVGSAIVKFIKDNHGDKDFIPKLKTFVSRLCMK